MLRKLVVLPFRLAHDPTPAVAGARHGRHGTAAGRSSICDKRPTQISLPKSRVIFATFVREKEKSVVEVTWFGRPAGAHPAGFRLVLGDELSTRNRNSHRKQHMGVDLFSVAQLA